MSDVKDFFEFVNRYTDSEFTITPAQETVLNAIMNGRLRAMPQRPRVIIRSPYPDFFSRAYFPPKPAASATMIIMDEAANVSDKQMKEWGKSLPDSGDWTYLYCGKFPEKK